MVGGEAGVGLGDGVEVGVEAGAGEVVIGVLGDREILVIGARLELGI